MKTVGFRLAPVDKEQQNDEADFKSLILRMERKGNLKAVRPMLIHRARALYVRKGLSKREVAKEVGVELSFVDRWIMSFGWDKMRQEVEFQQYKKVSGIRRRNIPNIDEKHDQMFHDLEAILEDTIYRLRNGEAEVSPRDLSTLANAARTCMDCRRVVHKKEGAASRQIIELRDNTVFTEFAAMLTDTLARPELTGEPINATMEVVKQIPCTVEDVEFEDESDEV